MGTIIDPQLSIEVDRAVAMATVAVTCGVEFTEFEVRTMNLLRMQYTLECQLLNMALLYPETVIHFVPRQFPRVRDGANAFEQPIFNAVAPTQRSASLYVWEGLDRGRIAIKQRGSRDSKREAHTSHARGPGTVRRRAGP
jgi:hypothetical protein